MSALASRRSLRQVAALGLERNAALLFWGMVLVQAGFGASDAYRTLFMEAVGASPAVIGILLAGFEAVRLVILVVTGSLAGRVSTRTMLRMRWLSALSGVLWLFASAWWMLVPGLIAQAGSSMAWPAVSRVVDESGPAAERQRRFLLIFTVAPGIALLGSPVLGAWIVERWGFRAIWLTLVLFCAAGTTFYTLVRPTSDGAVRASGGYRAVLRHGPSRTVALLTLATWIAITLGVALAPNYLHHERGMAYGEIGSLGVLVAIGSIGTALAIARFGRTLRPLDSALLVGGCLPLTFALLAFGSGRPSAIAAYLALGAGTVVQKTFRPAMSEVTPAAMRVRAFSLVEATIAAGVMVASLAAGQLYAIAPRLPLLAALVATTLALGGIALARRSLRSAAPTDA